MDYKQAEHYVFSYTDWEKQLAPHALANYDLRRVEELLARMGNPHLGAKSVHVAGTKGKGSTSAMIASALTASGYRTGLYTSPHLLSWRERMMIDGEPVPEADFVALVEQLQPEVEAVNRTGTYGELTTFELLTALGFAFFHQRAVDFQVLEVGMGGRYDATNVIIPKVAVLTSISLDHTEVLGDTVAKIAAEKCGIIKPGVTVVTSPQVADASRVIEEACVKQGARLLRVGDDVTWRLLSFNDMEQSLIVQGRLASYQLTIPLLGQHQLTNAATAVAALEVLAEKGFRVTADSITCGLAQVDWPGRLQVLKRCPTLVVDGAHNPDSAQKLRLALTEYFEFERATLVIGLSADKDMPGIVAELAPLFKRVIATRAHHPRARDPETIVAEFTRHGVPAETAEDVPAALSRAEAAAGPRDLICAAGSLFIVAEAIEAAGLPSPSAPGEARPG